jgi:hypothetical protein
MYNDCGNLWEIVEGKAEEEVIMNAVEVKLSNPVEPPNYISIKQRVRLFCTKHPKMKFTIECILNDHYRNKLELDKEIQDLVNDGILEKQISDAGTVWYYLLN